MAAEAVGGGTVLPFALSAFFSGRPGGGIDMPSSDQILRTFDPELWGAIDAERERRENHVELIASGNYPSPRVSAAQGALLTDQHAGGYPGKRDRGGCDFIDVAERLAVDRCRQLFRAEYANVQPHSGSQANQAVHLALLNPGDTILGMSLAHGGCPTRSEPVGRSGKIHHEVAYGLDADEVIDYAQVEALAHRHRPRLIVAGDEAEAVLGRAHVSVDKNAIPNDPRQPAATSGLRLGSPAVTTRGFGPAEIEQIGHVIADVLEAPRDDAVVARSASAVTALCARFPVHGQPMVPPARHSRPTLVVAR